MASSAAQRNPNPSSIPNFPPKPVPGSRKRPLDHAQSSPYFKIRLTLKHLRPLFIQVIRAPENQRTEATRAILEKMMLMVELSKQMAMEAPSMVPSEELVKLDKEDSSALNTCIIGGSAFGWNFVTYMSSKLEYYGRSKESFRASKPKSDG